MAGEPSASRGLGKLLFYCGKVPFVPTGIAPPVTAGTDGLTQLMHSSKGLWWWQAGEERKNCQVQNQVFCLCTDGGCVPWTL